MISHEGRKTSLHSFFNFLLVVSLSSIIVIFPWFYGLTRFRDQLVAELIIFILFLISIPSVIPRSATTRDLAFRININSINFWILASLALGLIYTIFSSVPSQSLLSFLRLLSGVLFFYLVLNAVTSFKNLQYFLWIVLLTGVGYSVYGLFQYYGYLSNTYWYQPTFISSRYVNGGHFAAYSLFPLLIGISLLFSSKNIFVKFLIFILILPIGFALLLSGSRTVWISFALASLLFLFLLGKNRLIGRPIILGMMLLFTGGMIFAFYQGWMTIIVQRIHDLTGQNFYSLIQRFYYWEGSLKAILARPWGWGLGTFGDVFPQFRVHSDRFAVDYAHNELFQIGVDLGIPGLLILIGMIVVYFKQAFKFLSDKTLHPPLRIMGAGFLAIFVAVAMSCLTDFPIRIYATGILFVGFLALSSYLFGINRQSNATVPSPFPRILIFLLVLIPTFLTSRHLLAQIHYEKGQKFLSDFNWNVAEQEYKKAIKLIPYSDEYRQTLATLYGKRETLSLNRDQKDKYRRLAIDQLKNAARIRPFRGQYYYELARFYEAGSNIKLSDSYFKKAMKLEPMNGFLLVEYGDFALRHNMLEDAIRVFEKFKNNYYFSEGRESSSCDILGKCFAYTQRYEDLRRVIRDTWTDHYCFASALAEKGYWEYAGVEFKIAMMHAKKSLDTNQYQIYRDQINNFYRLHNQPAIFLELS